MRVDAGERGVSGVRRALRRLFVLPIRLYQRLVSPLLPRSCRFRPTCSEYAARAVERHGVVKGLVKGAWRIMRCNPWFPGGDDPVG